MLAVKRNDLIDALTQPSMKVNDVVIRKSQNLVKVTYIVEFFLTLKDTLSMDIVH